MSTFLDNIGSAADIRKLVAESERDGTSISLILDRPRTLKVVNTTRGKTELIVQCKDNDASIVLHLPYAPNQAGQATIISYGEEH